jgi:glycine dehydrogenase subunit 2
MKLLYEKGAPGRALSILPACDVPAREIPEALARKKAPRLAHLSETEISRHYTQLAGRTHGVNDGFYPLGSCTMKYNPKIDDEMAALPGFALIHPLQPEADAQGCLEVLDALRGILTEVTGMDDMTFQPAAGAHREQTGLLMIKAYHKERGDLARTKVIVPDSAHGTNPASASMAGMTVVSIPSTADGCVDLEALRRAVGPDTAGLMLTNPNTLGIFDHNILEITRIVHEAGGLNYYDGANLNAIMGVVRPGDMGFDVVHLNLHKTFATPHGGGGPGAGAVGVRRFWPPSFPGPGWKRRGGYRFAAPDKSIGAVKAFYGNFLVVVRASPTP